MRDKIVNRAKELFFTFGIRCVTMDDVARKAGISKKTLYTYYPKKPDLVSGAVTSLLNCHKQSLDDCRREAADEVDEVLRASQIPFQAIATINPLFFYEVEKFHPDAYQQILEHTQHVVLISVLENLKSGIYNGCYRRTMDIDFTSRIRVEQLISALNRKTDTGLSQMEMMRQYSEFYLHAIVTEKGNSLLMKYTKTNNELN